MGILSFIQRKWDWGRPAGGLWFRRVLVRAQEGQWPAQQRRPFSLGAPPTSPSATDAPMGLPVAAGLRRLA
jgi:hypothetical protein